MTTDDDQDQVESDLESLQSSESEEGSDADQDGSSESDIAGNEDVILQGTSSEIEIEGDFDRLVESIRLTDGPSQAGMLSKVWDFSIEEKEAEFRDDLRAASGIGRKRKKGTRRTGPPLSLQVRNLIGDGNAAYIDNNLPETIRIMQEVIRIEPRASSAWSVLAQCYEDLREPQKALQLRIMAAHLSHDAEEWDRLAKQSKDLGFTQQALYCYRKLHSLDPNNVDALWDRASLAKESGDLRTARHSLQAILKRFPHDLTVLGELRPVLIELSDLSTCATLFQNAFDHYQAICPLGHVTDPETGAEIPAGGFGLMEILVLTDLYNTLQEYDRAIATIRRGCRWLQGRSEQRYWDICEDDREYDVTHDGRDVSGRDGEVQPGMFPLDVNARHRLAIARIKMGELEEGKLHANIILSQDVYDYAPLFVEIADAYFERELYTDARPIYELLGTDAATSSLYILLQTAACLRMLGDLREAAEVYEHVIGADPGNNDSKMKLAEIYEIVNEPRKALELVYEVIDSRKKKPNAREENPAVGTQTASLFEEKSKGKGKAPASKSQHRLNVAQLRELEAQKEREVLRGYHRLMELWPRILNQDEGQDEAEREWTFEAEKLVDTFRETRNLFLTTRSNPFRGMFPRSRPSKTSNEAEEDRMASRLHLDLEHDSIMRKSKGKDVDASRVDIFRGVQFDDWLRVFMQYAFLLTKSGRFNVADEILRHILLSNAYQTRRLQDTIRLTLITCAIATQRYPIVIEQCRKLIGAHQFNNEPLRILVASLASGLRPTDSFIASTLQKHLSREIRVADTAVKNKDSLRWNPLNKRYAPVMPSKGGDGDEAVGDEIDEEVPADVGEKENLPLTPTKNNPINVTVYGQICIAAKSYQSAIFYLLHAYDYCPEDPMICLCLSIASLGRAMQRQADNRQHLITQAMAFLTKYRILRRSTPQCLAEVEYNFGRAFQQLGLHTHAVRHYERVLQLASSENQDDDNSNVSREAAYNLSLIYVMTGATPLAEALYRRWLSL